ncbi:MAG TPA: hypothetical protein DDZ80_12130 [Cyanobacteria bacterium UBA8803]|nr:hypothetical protein [Cyanobacteria bacterium UBA9273]HBL59227.1 hypothetical protein [Cyanobacteria bacterium UBA8803]
MTNYYLLLFLLTLLLVTTDLPVAAQHSPSQGQLPILELRIASLGKETATDASTLLAQGRTLYEAGRIAEAAALWQQAADSYEGRGDRINQVLSLNYLSLAYQDLGQWQAAQTAINQSLNLIANHLQPTSNYPLILAQTLNTQGSLQLAMGKTEAALHNWEQAAIAYAQAGDEAGVLGSQINQAQALQTLGLYRRAQTLLEEVNQKLKEKPDSLLKATELQSLGVALQVVGDLQQSQNALEQSLAITQQLNSSLDTSAILFSLGNTARALQDYPKAIEFYQKAAEQATTSLSKVEAQLNQVSLLLQSIQETCASVVSPCRQKEREWSSAQSLLPQIQAQLTKLPPSRASVYARVNLAENSIRMSTWAAGNRRRAIPSQHSEISQLLTGAIQQAREIKDPRAESYALGQLGRLYEQTQQWSEAQNLTQAALQIAQAMNASDIAYRWQWQLGRILKQQGNLQGAIAANSEAVYTLQSLRSDLVTINSDIQFSFRETVEPVYRELVELLLQPVPGSPQPGGGISQQNLEKARKVIELLQLAELDNFFREACLDAKPEQIDKIDPTAAVVYPIILSDRLAVILSLPGQSLVYYETKSPQTEVESILDQMLQSFNPSFSNRQRLRLSQQVYNWLIRPAEAQLAQSGIKTLVFVLDGSLRNLPMAALHDGERYLVEKYSIALSQGLQLLQPRSLNRKRLEVLTGGLTEARHGFSALPAVESELQQIASEVRSEILLNQEFTKTTLENQIKNVPFAVIHLATHGQFSSKAEKTFLLTWDSRINVKDLDELLRSRERQDTEPIELLVLSACQTAAGDKRATLGLAGVALRSGARSTLGTLWSVSDRSTANLMAEFYRDLIQPNVTKAEALRQAQLALLQQSKYQHPFYWAPFVLIGNWL